MPTASTSKPGMSRLPTAGGSRIPVAGGTRIPVPGGKSTMATKALAKEKEDALAGKKRGLVLQSGSPNPKARKILRTSNAPAPAGSKPSAALQKPTQHIARKRSLGSPPASARKRQRTELPLRSSARAVDPLDVIPPTPPRPIGIQDSASQPSPSPRAQAPMERARSTTAFNIPLGDQSSLLGGAEMDISSAGLYSDFENRESLSPVLKKSASARTVVNNARRSSIASNSRRSSVTPKPRQKATTPRRSPKSARRPSVTPRRYEPKTLPPPIVTPTAMQAKKEARRAEAQAKLAAARSEAEAPSSSQTMTNAQARLAAAQAEAERRLRMSVESEETEGLSVVPEESYREEDSERDDGLEEEREGGDGEGAEVEQEEQEEQEEEEQEGEDTLEPLRDEDEDYLPAPDEIWSSQVETPRASGSNTTRRQSRATTTPAFKPTTTPATRSTTTPAYKPTTTPATVKPSKTTASTTPATGFKGKRKVVFGDTPHPQPSESPSEYDPGEHEESDDPAFYNRRPSLGFAISQLSLDSPDHPLRSPEAMAKMLLEEDGEIANRTRSRLAIGGETRRESLAGAMNGLKLAGQKGEDEDEDEGEDEEGEDEDEDNGDDDQGDDDQGDETIRRPRKSITATPRTSGPSYSTTPRDYPSTTPRHPPSTTPRYDRSALPEDASTTPRNDPSISGSTTPFYPSTSNRTMTPDGEPSTSRRNQPRKSGSPVRGRGRARGRGRSVSRDGRTIDEGEGQSDFLNDQTQQSAYDDQSVLAGRSPTPRRGRGRGRGRGRASPQKGGDTSRRVSRTEVEQDSGSEEDLSEPTESAVANRTKKTKSPMKMEVVIPRRGTTAFGKSVSKTPVFKPMSSMSSFQPTASTSSSQPIASTSSSKPSTSVSEPASTFGSLAKVTLQQPTPDLSSLDRSPGSHQDMIAEGSVTSRQDDEHMHEGGDLSQSLGSQHEFNASQQHDPTGSQHESTSSRRDMDESADSRRDVDMNFTDEVPETSLPGSPAERHEPTKLPIQSSFSHLLERDMTMRSERTASVRMETLHRTTTAHPDMSRSTTMSRSVSIKSHTPAAKKKPEPKKTQGLKILPDSQISRMNAFTPRAPPAPIDDSIEFTPASRFDFNESRMDFDETPAAGTRFAQSTPFIRNGARPSLGLGTFQELHLDDSEEEEDIPDSQPAPSEDGSQQGQTETTPQREISVAVDTSSPNRSLRTERVATPRAPRLSNAMDDEEDDDEPELPPSPSAGRSNLHEGSRLPDDNGINGRKLSDILMARAKQARDRSGHTSQDQGRSDVLGAGEMTRLSDQARSLLKQPSGSGSQSISTGEGSHVLTNRSTSFGASTSRSISGHNARRPGLEISYSQQEQVEDYDASVRFDGPSRTTQRRSTPVFRRSNQPDESDEDEVSSVPDQTEELRSSGASVVSPAQSDAPEEAYEVAESKDEDDEEMDYDENGEPLIKLSGPPEALIEAKSALIQLGYIEDEERMERYSRARSSRSRSRSMSRIHDSTRNFSIGSSPRSHLGDRTNGLSRSQMMVEASRYEDWEPPSRRQLRTRRWTEHDWRMLAHYMRRVQKSQALKSGLSSRQEFDLRNVDIPAVVERFVEEESHGLKLEGEWDRAEIAGRVEFLIKTEGYKKDGSWKSTMMNITVPGLSTQKTRRYEPEEASPEVESPAKGRMLPAALSERPGPSRIAAAEKQVAASASRATLNAALVTQSTKPAAHIPKQTPAHTKRTAQTIFAEPPPPPLRQEPQDMSIDQPSLEEPCGEEPSVEQSEQPSAEEFSVEEEPVEEPRAQEYSVEERSIEDYSAGEPHVEEPPVEEQVEEQAEESVAQEEEQEEEEVEGAEEEEVEEVGEGGGDYGGDRDGEDEEDEEEEEEQHSDPFSQHQTYQAPISASPAQSRSPPKSRRQANTSTITNRGLETSMRSAGAPPTPIARFFGTISSYIGGRSQAKPTGEPSMPILRPVSRDPIDLIDDDDDEPLFPVLNHVPTPIRPTPARKQRQKRVEPRIDMPALQHVSPVRPATGSTRGRPRMRRVASVKELARSFEQMEEKSREEAEIARNLGMRRVVSESGKPRLIPAQVHYSAPSAPVELNRPRALPKPARTAPAVPSLPAVPRRAAPAPSTRKPLKQPTRSRPSRPSAAKKKVVPKKEVEVITISDTET
ncbi:Mucin-4 [Rhizoctonia solani]|uniref:Mucin-4 n=1 Tax=Rhizoctonia solani TaxID=456999 RepID=A0A0K6G6B8_9AGAM|nr:Mucin-4 [Rhizoctonia solani]